MSYKEVRAGSTATVRSIRTQHPSARKLRMMGLDQGSTFRVEHVAPLGDPLVITVQGCRLALRRKDLDAMEYDPNQGGGMTP